MIGTALVVREAEVDWYNCRRQRLIGTAVGGRG